MGVHKLTRNFRELITAAFVVLRLIVPAAAEELELGAPFSDNAVLQQGIRLPVWGRAAPGTMVTVSFGEQRKAVQADRDGEWRVVLDALKAAKLKSVNDCPAGKTMKIVAGKAGGQKTSQLKNLVVGDVWLCAGQSNMAGRMKRAGHPKNYPTNSVNSANYPALRMLNVEKKEWMVCTPQTAVRFSRVSFFFARRVQKDALVPLGVITRAVGGSNIESWLNREPYPTGGNYSRLMTPVVGYGIRGAIWYQGESNAKDGMAYLPKLTSLILGWRDAWDQGAFPVYYVQLPGIGKSSVDEPGMGDGRAAIRQAYFEALAIKNTGMAITIDVGSPGEHPPNKYDTGVRLARLALHNDYGFKKLVPSGPLYDGHKIEGSTVRISFNHAQNGLMVAVKVGFLPPRETSIEKLQWLSIQDKDGDWHWAKGKIDGSDLVVSCDAVKSPVAVRYAYTGHPEGHILYNRDGIPAGPFATDQEKR